MKSVPYEDAVGSTLYAAIGTWPDIAQATGSVSRFNKNPKEAYWVAVMRILRYLKGTVNQKLEYSCDGNTELEGFADADWANDEDERRSVSGVFYRLQGGAVSWQSEH